MRCEMCGKETELFKTDVEGSLLSLCKECSKFGKIISVIREEKKEIKKKVDAEPRKEEEIILTIVPDYGNIIKKKREEMGIKQEDFAKRLNEKVSLIHKIEINQFELGIDLARKIERFLHIKLIEQQELKPEKVGGIKGEHFTIGDFIKIKQ